MRTKSFMDRLARSRKPGLAFPMRLEVGPKRAAKETVAVQNEHVVTQL
jgi:hypothetical protein